MQNELLQVLPHIPIPISLITPDPSLIDKTWQTAIVGNVGGVIDGFEFDKFINVDVHPINSQQQCDIIQYEILDTLGNVYITKFDQANNLPIAPKIQARHDTANQDILETLYFRIRVTLNDNFPTPDNGYYDFDYNPLIAPTQEVFPPLGVDDHFAIKYACYKSSYNFDYNDPQLVGLNPLGYIFKRQENEFDSFIYQSFKQFTTTSPPCKIGSYKVCFNPDCTPAAENDDIDIVEKGDPTYCPDISLPCNYLKIRVGFETLENMEFLPYIKAVSTYPISEIEFYKELNTEKISIQIKCGDMHEKFNQTIIKERFIFAQRSDLQDFELNFDTVFENDPYLLTSGLQNLSSSIFPAFNPTINQYFQTDKPQCPVYDYSLINTTDGTNLGDPEENTNSKIQLRFDGKDTELEPPILGQKKREDNIVSNWLPRLWIRGNQTVNENGIELQGMTAGNERWKMILEIGVCGNESIVTQNKTDLLYVFRHAQVNGTNIPKKYIIDYEFLDSLFEFHVNQGFEECYDSLLELFQDKTFLNPWLDPIDPKKIELTGDQDEQIITIDLSQQFEIKTLYLRRKIRGNPLGTYFAYKKIQIESCGKETISVVKKGIALKIQSTFQFSAINKLLFEDLQSNFESSSKNCPIFQLGLADITSSKQRFILYPNETTFRLDINYNLHFNTDKLGIFKAYLTPMAHSNYDYIQFKLEVLERPIQKINQPPQFKGALHNYLYDFTKDEKVLEKLASLKGDLSHEIHIRIQLPEISDDSKENYKILLINDLFKSSKATQKGLGSVENRGLQLNKLNSKFQFMDYDIAGRFVVIQFKTINDLLSVDGVHPIQITLSDEEEGKNIYSFNIQFIVPPRPIKEKKKQSFAVINVNQTVTANIESISDLGLMNITFDKPMHTKFNLTTLNTSNIEMWLAPVDNWHLEQEVTIDIKIFNFTWNVTKFNITQMEVQLTFNAPPQISQTSQYDSIVVNFLTNDVVVSINKLVLNNNSTWLTCKIPKQITNSPENKSYASATQDSKMILIYALILNIFVSYFARGGYEYMISMINALQIILHLPIFIVAWPAPIMQFYEKILPFVMFDIIEAFDTINTPFQAAFQWEDSKNDVVLIYDQTQTLGYDSYNPMLNLGTMSLVMMIYIFKIIILLICVYPFRKKFGFCTKCFKRMKNSMFFGEILTIFIETHLELCLAGTVMMQITYLKKEDTNQDYNGVMFTIGGIFLFISLVFMPSIFIWLLCQKKSRYLRKPFQRKWGILLQGVKVRNKWQVSFYFIFVLRRIMFTVGFAFLDDYPALQIQLLSYTNLVMLIYTGMNSPLVSKFHNKIELTNETFIIICEMYLFLYSDMCPDKAYQYRISFYNIQIICIMIAFNMTIVLYYSVRAIFFIFYQYYIVSKHWFSTKFLPAVESKIQNWTNPQTLIQQIPEQQDQQSEVIEATADETANLAQQNPGLGQQNPDQKKKKKSTELKKPKEPDNGISKTPRFVELSDNRFNHEKQSIPVINTYDLELRREEKAQKQNFLKISALEKERQSALRNTIQSQSISLPHDELINTDYRQPSERKSIVEPKLHFINGKFHILKSKPKYKMGLIMSQRGSNLQNDS